MCSWLLASPPSPWPAPFFTYRGTFAPAVRDFLCPRPAASAGPARGPVDLRRRLDVASASHRRNCWWWAPDTPARPAAQLQRYAWADVDLIGYVDDDRASSGKVYAGAPVLGDLDSAPRLVKVYQVNTPSSPCHDAHERGWPFARCFSRAGCACTSSPSVCALLPGAALEGFGGIPVIDLGVPGIYGWRRIWSGPLTGAGAL